MQTFLHKTGVSAKKADQDAGTGIAISGLVPIFRSASLEDKHSKKEDVRGVEKVSNRDQPRAPREPRPSEALKPNGKSIRTDSYSMARPALLGEVTKIIDDGIKRLQRSGSKNDDERLEVYREAFQKFIDEFNIYRPVLMSVKREYDSRLSGLREKLTTYSSYDSEMAVKEQETINKIRNIQHYSEIKIQQVTDRARDLEMTVLKLESEKKLLQTELQQSEEVNMRLSNDCDEMRNTCVTLTNSLSRLEEERRISKALESTMSSEISNLKFSEGKANEEIERLEQVVQAMEQAQSNMVPVDVLGQAEAAAEAAKTDLKRLEGNHRQLLVRYTTVKSVIDAAYKKWEKHSAESFEGLQQNMTTQSQKLRAKVDQAILFPEQFEVGVDDHTEVNSLRPETGESTDRPNDTSLMVLPKSAPSTKEQKVYDTAEKIMTMIRNGANPRIIIECLLDQIQGIGDNFRDLHSRGSEHGNKHLNDKGEVSSHFTPHGTMSGSQEVVRVGDYVYRGSINVHGATVAYDGESYSSAVEEFRSPWSHFNGLGYGSTVPVFLQFSGKLQNLFLSKMDVVKIINEVWRARLEHQQLKLEEERATAVNNSDNIVALEETMLSIANSEGSPAPGPAIDSRPNTVSGRSVTSDVGARSQQKKAGKSSVAIKTTDPGSPRRKAAASRSGKSIKSEGADTVADKKTLDIPVTPALFTLPSDCSMGIFLLSYLEDKFKSRTLAVELIYNLVDAMKKYSALSDCKLFQLVLDDKLSMDAWSDIANICKDIKEELKKEKPVTGNTAVSSTLVDDLGISEQVLVADAITTSDAILRKKRSEWKISHDSFLRVLRRVLHGKGDHAFTRLSQAIALDSNGSKYVSPYELLHEDSSGIRSNFLEQLKLQHISESIIFERHVIDCVDQAVISFGATNKSNVGEEATGDITIGKLREALCLADPNKPRPEINQLLARGYGLSVETVLIYEARRTLVSSEEFKRCIHSILLKKSPATTKATL